MSGIAFSAFTVGAGGQFPGPPDAVITRQPILDGATWQGPAGEIWMAISGDFVASCDEGTGDYLIVQQAADWMAGAGRVELEFATSSGFWTIRLYMADGSLFHTMLIAGTGTDTYDAAPCSPSGNATMDVDVTQIPVQRQVLVLDPYKRTTRWDRAIDPADHQVWTGVNRFRNTDGIYMGDTADRMQMVADAGAGGRLLIGRAGTPTSSAIIADGQFQLRQGTNIIILGPTAAYAGIRGDINQLKLLCPTTGTGLIVQDTAEAVPMPIDAGQAVLGNSNQTATNYKQLSVRKGGTGGPECFYVNNRDGAGLDLGIDRYLNLTRDGFANGQIGVGAAGVSTFRAGETNIPIMVQGRGANNSFGGCVFILNRTAPNDAALTPLIRFGVGLAYNSVTPDIDVYHGLHTEFHHGIKAANLPTTDPATAGMIWNDAGTLKVSAG